MRRHAGMDADNLTDEGRLYAEPDSFLPLKDKERTGVKL
jgi:hypothetical protein